MRIVEVAEFYAPKGGGVRTYIDRKFEEAAKNGCQLFVLAPASEDGFEPRAGGGGVVWIKAPALPFDPNYHLFWDSAPIHAALDRLRPDLVEASSPWRGAWIAARWPGRAPRALFMHSDPVASYPQRWLGPVAGPARIDRLFEGFWRYLRRLSGRFDVVVAGGDWLSRRLGEHGVGPISTVGLGVDRTMFSPARRDPALRERLLAQCELPPTARLVLGVGRHHAEKRWPMVIEAVASVGAELPIGLYLIGDGVDRRAVERAAGANPHIRLAEPIHDRAVLATLLASADALIHGGESETFGLVAAEALASGTALITPNRGGCADLARPPVGETFAPNDSRSAAAAIRRLFARDPHRLRAAVLEGAAGVRSDRQHFADLFELYAGLCDTAPAAARSGAMRSA
jgi:alpha-1,6-mannosyltransferase